MIWFFFNDYQAFVKWITIILSKWICLSKESDTVYMAGLMCGLLLPSCKDSNNHCSQLSQLKTVSNEKNYWRETNIIFHLNNVRLLISLVTREARKFSLIYCFDKTLYLQIFKKIHFMNFFNSLENWFFA